jgi:hypothetical protein
VNLESALGDAEILRALANPADQSKIVRTEDRKCSAMGRSLEETVG